MKTPPHMIHDTQAAFEHLARTARTHTMMVQRGIHYPYANELAQAAIAYTIQLAIDEGGADVDKMRALETQLMEIVKP